LREPRRKVVEIRREAGNYHRNAVYVSDLDDGASFFGTEKIEAPEDAPILVRGGDVQPVDEYRSVSLELLR
jgi:hypothetical protein